MRSDIFIAPPGAGKTTFKLKHPGIFIDPEESIDWKRMDAEHGLYRNKARCRYSGAILEHELDWPTVWIEEVLPRLRAAMILEKSVIMGMITPSDAEIVSRFLQAFRKNTTLILPDEERHFRQIWNDAKKRGRSWGPELRGWQNTFWIRSLLLGLAADIGIKIVEEPSSPKAHAVRKPCLAAREAVDDKRKRFIEVFFGRWAELDESDEIVAMHIETGRSEAGIAIKCDRTAKSCGRGLHGCGTVRLLNKDVHGHDLATWVAQDKLHTPARGRAKNALIFFAGTLAPFHRGHLEALNAAKAFLESRGWHVMGGYASAFVNVKDDRLGSLRPVLGPAHHRSVMLQLGTMFSDWLMPDFPTEHVLRSSLLEQGRHPAQLLAKRLREHGALSVETPVTTFWVNGKDAHLDPDFVNEFARHTQDDDLNPLRLLIMDNRPGKDNWSRQKLAVAASGLLPFVHRCKIRSTDPTSATAVREALMAGDRIELKRRVGLPLVEAYLMGLMHKCVDETR